MLLGSIIVLEELTDLGECFFRSEKEAVDNEVEKASRTNVWLHTYQVISREKTSGVL